jgi:hypothetical protein
MTVRTVWLRERVWTGASSIVGTEVPSELSLRRS